MPRQPRFDLYEIVAVCKKARLAMCRNNEMCEITVMLDENGDETDSTEDAVVGVAAKPDGKFEVIEYDQYEPVTQH